jgi:hypothetical protein
LKTLALAICLLFPVEVVAGNLNPSQGGPAGASEILDDMQGWLPIADNTNGAAVDDVRYGKTFWGVRTDGTWGLNTGHLYGGYTCSGSMSGTRWCENGDGTVRDMTTGLVWLKETNCSAHLGGINKTGLLTWDAARSWSSFMRNGYCGLGDGSVMGDWRLPTITEMASIMKGNDPVRPGTPRLFKHVQPSDYWTNTTDSTNESSAWAANHGNGTMRSWLKTSYSYVWLVRSGQ